MVHNMNVILVAEDDPGDRLLIKEGFEEGGLKGDLRFIQNGEELMDYLYRRGKYDDPTLSPRPGLILLDLHMPRKDGGETLAEIKADPNLRSIPVVVLTTSKAQNDIALCYELGANSYITKPMAFSDLVDVLKALGGYWLETVELPLPPET